MRRRALDALLLVLGTATAYDVATLFARAWCSAHARRPLDAQRALCAIREDGRYVSRAMLPSDW